MERYTKIKKIGEGSFGKALLVRHKENGKQFVVKEINMSKMAKKERDEARKEVAVLAQLNHPNIVTYKESFEEIGNLYIVMDFCDAGDLYGRINSQRGALFTEDQIIDWFVQTCLAIKHIHDRKILHRDIKSQNIFLTRHGIVKLGDFGIAKVLNSTVELARTCIGTPYYLSPEICENKPYNNKSDIWSLGCVLYELTTLKHAFEAGNMKNLVLKIIRGNFPPPPSRYSYDLRSLINQLFKRSPRDRPSINSVLKKPILQARIRKFLSESEVAEEFSHTVMHGVKMKKALPSGGGRPLPPKPVAAKKPPSAPTPRYNPASVYGVPVNRKSKDSGGGVVKKSSDGVRKSGGMVRRPVSASGGGNADLAKRKQELIEKEKRRQEEAKKKENMYARQHQELIEKQKIARMNRAREDAWKNVIDSQSSEESNPSSPPVRVPLKERPNYDHYHEYLDKLDRDRKAAAGDAPPQQRPVSARDAPPAPVAGFDPAMNAARGQAAGVQGHVAAEKARVVEEYMQRKAQAAHNRARALGDLHGGAKGAVNPGVRAPAPKPSVGAPTPSAVQQRPGQRIKSSGSKESPSAAGKARPLSAREKQEQEYLARLKQIRLQNFNERRGGAQDKAVNRADDRYKPSKNPDPKNDAEVRKKKIEALRAQADERARRLKEDLERKRKAAYEQEKRNLQGHPVVKPANRPVAHKPVIAAKPLPAVPITHVLNAIGAAPHGPAPSKEPSIGMTAAMNAIGASREEENRVSIQKTKEQILKRLNAKSIDPENSKEVAQEEKQDRPKWGQPVKDSIQVERPKWGEQANADNLSQIELEQTSSQMEATSAGDHVLKHEEVKQQEVDDKASRKSWATKPSSTVLNLLKAAELRGTQAVSVSSESTESNVTSPESTVSGSTVTISKPEDVKPPIHKPVIGSTITISRGGPKQGTVVLKKADSDNQTDTADSVEDTKKTVDVSDKELVMVEDKEKDESDENQPEPQGQGDKTQSQGDKTPGQGDKTQLDIPADQVQKTKSRSPSPKANNSPKNKTKPKKIYQPEIEVEIIDLPGGDSPLFSRVDLDEDDKDSGGDGQLVEMVDLDDSEETPGDRSKQLASTQVKSKSGLLMSLQTGNFDIGDIKLLRTCSEPNLSKLFETDVLQNPFFTEEEVAKSVHLVALASDSENEDEVDEVVLVRDSLQKVMDAEDLEDDEDNLGDLEYSIKDIPTLLGDDDDDDDDDLEEFDTESKSEEQEVDNVDGSEDDEDEEEEDGDMETLRQSMMDILDNDVTISDEESVSSTKKKKSKKVSKEGKKARQKRRERLEAAAVAGSNAHKADGDKKSMYARQWSASSVEDFKSMRETMKSLLQPDSGTKSKLSPVKEVGPSGDSKIDQSIVSLNPNTEAWQSDDDEGDDDYWEEEDMFSRLEESRMKLEEELGCDTFMKAYKTVQAIHEDEDEKMEEGLKLISSILGDAKSHLYPSILQLVMADGVWTEDND